MGTSLGFYALILAGLISNNYAYDFIGCWRGSAKDIPEQHQESMESAFGPVFHELAPSEAHSNTCLEKAKEKRLDYYVIADNKCRGGVHTGLTYRKYGSSDDCDENGSVENTGKVYALEGSYIKDSPDEKDAQLTATTTIPNTSSKKSEINPSPEASQGAEVIRKDLILMNDVFKKFYGENLKYYGQPAVLRGYPENDNFNTYYDNEADTYTWEKRKEGSPLHRSASTNNLFENADFELPMTKPSGHHHWNCYGEVIHGHAGNMSRSSQYKHHGNHSGLCTHRVSFHAGPGQFVGHAVKGGRAYKVHGWTKLLNASKSDLHTIELWVRYQGNDVSNGTETRILLAKRDKFNKNDDWQEWNSQFFMPEHKPGFRYVHVYFKGPKSYVNILLDEMVLRELPLAEDWLEELKEKTDRLRKRDVMIRLNFNSATVTEDQLRSIRVKISQKRSHFGFGSAVHHKHLDKHPAYRQFFLRNFEWGVPESAMKWNEMEGKKGKQDHRDMDVFVSTLHKYNITIRGHCLFWEVGDMSPKRLDKLNKKQLFKALKERLKDTVERYKSKIAHWDVNNEMLHGSYFADKLGPNIRDWMYKTVHEEDRKSRLFLNDFDVVANSFFTQSYLEQIMGFKKRGVPIHGIGVQGHFLGWTHPSILKERLDILGKAGIPIWITEMDVLEHNETKRARDLEHIMRLAYGHPSVAGLVLWAFWSKSAWRGADTALIDDEFELNKAGRRYLELRKEWTTKLTLKPSKVFDNSCEFKFRGHHGIYDISVLFPDGQKITNEVNLTPKTQPLIIEINTSTTELHYRQWINITTEVKTRDPDVLYWIHSSRPSRVQLSYLMNKDPLPALRKCNALWDTQGSAMYQSEMEDKVAHYISKAEGGLSYQDEIDENEK